LIYKFEKNEKIENIYSMERYCGNMFAIAGYINYFELYKYEKEE
jgi:hypothetical protein